MKTEGRLQGPGESAVAGDSLQLMEPHKPPERGHAEGQPRELSGLTRLAPKAPVPRWGKLQILRVFFLRLNETFPGQLHFKVQEESS